MLVNAGAPYGVMLREKRRHLTRLFFFLIQNVHVENRESEITDLSSATGVTP
jgi:hypothetical protein